MRSVAPDRPGMAASQNSWSVRELKPTAGSLATTTDQTIQTAKASSSAGIEIQRLRRAIARPFSSQKAWSSGFQSFSTWPDSAPTCFSSWIGCISGNCGSFSSPGASASRSMRWMARCIQISEPPAIRNSSMKQLVQMPVRSLSTPKAIGSTKPPRPPIMPTRPPTEPTLSG